MGVVIKLEFFITSSSWSHSGLDRYADFVKLKWIYLWKTAYRVKVEVNLYDVYIWVTGP